METTLAALTKPSTKAVEASFFNTDGFALIQRVATLFTESTMVPEAYRRLVADKRTGEVRENKNALPNCVVALNMAHRIGADPLMVMQNLYVVEGRPAWSSQFIISAINASGKFSPLRFEITDLGEKTFNYTTSEWVTENGKRRKIDTPHTAKLRDLSCVAWATEKGGSGDRLESPAVTIAMAVDEGWYGKNGSKWRTMPEMMLRYRAASFFGRLYAPELLMGIQTEDEAVEVIDIEPATIKESPAAVTTEELKKKTKPKQEAPKQEEKPAPEVTPEVTPQVEEKEEDVPKMTAAQNELADELLKRSNGDINAAGDLFKELTKGKYTIDDIGGFNDTVCNTYTALLRSRQ